MGDVWAGLDHFEMIEECRALVDARRLLLESPLSQEWYFGERVRDWRTVPLADRPIPVDVPLHTFWPHLMPDLDLAMYARGTGALFGSQEGNYLEFIRRRLLPPCPHIHPDDPEEEFTDDDHDSHLDYWVVGTAAPVAEGEEPPFRGRAGPTDQGPRGRTSRGTSSKRSRMESGIGSHYQATSSAPQVPDSFLEGRINTAFEESFNLLSRPGGREVRRMEPRARSGMFDPSDATHVSTSVITSSFMTFHSLTLACLGIQIPVSEATRAVDHYSFVRDLLISQDALAMVRLFLHPQCHTTHMHTMHGFYYY